MNVPPLINVPSLLPLQFKAIRHHLGVLGRWLEIWYALEGGGSKTEERKGGWIEWEIYTGCLPFLSTDQLQSRQGSVIYDSQCQFHARGNHLRKCRVGFLHLIRYQLYLCLQQGWGEKPITECDSSERLPQSIDRVSAVCHWAHKYFFQMLGACLHSAFCFSLSLSGGWK